MHALTRRHLLKLGLASGVVLATGLPARALVNIVVTGGNFTPLPIAVPDFASSDAAFGKEVAASAHRRPSDVEQERMLGTQPHTGAAQLGRQL